MPRLSLILLLSLVPVHALAQSSPSPGLSRFAGVAATTQTDDETHLGRGLLGAAGVGIGLHANVRIEAEVSVGRHHRQSGYLDATGTPVVGTLRATWLLGSPTATVRPFVSAGPMLMHTTGEFRVRSVVPGPDGWPVEGPITTRGWRVTTPGVELGLGVEIAGTRRLWWRPEIRVSGTRAKRDYDPFNDVLEVPILTLRGGLSVIW